MMRELIYAYIQVILEGVDFHAQINLRCTKFLPLIMKKYVS